MNLGTTIPQFLTVGVIAQMVRAVSMAILRNFSSILGHLRDFPFILADFGLILGGKCRRPTAMVANRPSSSAS